MSLKKICLGLIGLAFAAQMLSACGGDDAGIYVVGYVYDGATGARITAYSLNVKVRKDDIKAKVEGDGRYVVGPIPPFQDYTVVITSAGYRAFRSTNAAFTIPNDATLLDPTKKEQPVDQTYFADAYLMPDSLQVAETFIDVRFDDDATKKPTGKVLLRPVRNFALGQDPSQLSAIQGESRVFTNDEDLQGKSISKDFMDGKITLAAGELLYGVVYVVTIFQVENYAPFDSGGENPNNGGDPLLAGQQLYKQYYIEPQTKAPLAIDTFTKPADCVPSTTMPSSISVTFNYPIEFNTSASNSDTYIEGSMQIDSPDANTNFTYTALKSTGSRGVTLEITDKTLKITFDPTMGLQTSDDPLRCYKYNYSYGYPYGLYNVYLQEKGRASNYNTIGQMLNTLTGGETTSFLCRGTNEACVLDDN